MKSVNLSNKCYIDKENLKPITKFINWKNLPDRSIKSTYDNLKIELKKKNIKDDIKHSWENYKANGKTKYLNSR